MYNLLIFIVILIIDVCNSQMSPRTFDFTSDYDAYGLKIAANDFMLVEALGDTQLFLIRYTPLNKSSQSIECPITYNDLRQYIYSVGIGDKQNSSQSYFFYIGEIISNDSLTYGDPFVGILINKDPQISQESQISSSCSYFQYESLQPISSYGHQEFFVIGVEPFGQYAIGIAKDFVFIYRPFSDKMLTIKNSSLIWTSDTIFLPIAIDTDVLYTIVAGFIVHGPLFRVRATPTVYVISNFDLSILSSWSYTAILNSWQSHLIYSKLKNWSNKYIMSVDINREDSSQILVGMSLINIVFSLIVSSNGYNLTLDSFIDNGDSRGFGKSVAWLSNSEVAILNSNYPSDESSRIYLYTSLQNRSLPLTPSVIFPNIQQTLPTTINIRLLRMISTANSLVILDIDSELLLILSSPPGYFSSTSYPIANSILLSSQSLKCMGGTYKNTTSIFPCSLCPSGTRNLGNHSSISCRICSSNSFCPMGSVVDIDRRFLSFQSQAHVHPRSPEVTVFDEILLQNMFSTSSNDHCLLVSPLFWVLIVVGIILIILSLMGILKRCVRHPKGHKVREHVKRVFRQTDLINEGEMWVGGLVTFAIVVLLIFAYTFSASFYRGYPVEDNDGPLIFACGQPVRNAKYESNLQSLSIPVSKEEQHMFNLLNKQHFTLRLDLLNTIASCNSLSIHQILGSSTNKLISSCTNSNGILTTAIELSYQKMIIRLIVDNISLIGGVRISLLARGNKTDSYQLRELDFSQTFYDNFHRTLSQTTNINLELTKAINETEPYTGHGSTFSGLWYPTFIIDENQMFMSSDEFSTSINLTSTKLTITISETSFYIKNRQLPIAKLGEIIFHNLLFTIVCLEIFRLIILLSKLTILPLLNKIVTHFRKNNEILSQKIKTVDVDTETDDQQITQENGSIQTKHSDDIELSF